jgi:hypothetical protein
LKWQSPLIAAKRAQTGGPIVAAAAVNQRGGAGLRHPVLRRRGSDPDTGNPNLPKGAAMSRNTNNIPFRQPDAVDDALSERARGRHPSNAGASVGC